MSMNELNRSVARLKHSARELRAKSNQLLTNTSFSYVEQELIRRVFKSVYSQIKGVGDKSTARAILEKTEWLDSDETV